VAVGAHFAFNVEIVEEDEVAGELVVVGCDALWKEAECRIAVSLGHVAEHLVVGAVLLNYVKAVFDRRGVTSPEGNGIVWSAIGNAGKGSGHAAIGLRGPA